MYGTFNSQIITLLSLAVNSGVSYTGTLKALFTSVLQSSHVGDSPDELGDLLVDMIYTRDEKPSSRLKKYVGVNMTSFVKTMLTTTEAQKVHKGLLYLTMWYDCLPKTEKVTALRHFIGHITLLFPGSSFALKKGSFVTYSIATETLSLSNVALDFTNISM